MTTRKCYTCDTVLQCDDRPVTLVGYVEIVVRPKFNAPLICLECRKDKKKFQAARAAMFKYFNWKVTINSGALLKEL